MSLESSEEKPLSSDSLFEQSLSRRDFLKQGALLSLSLLGLGLNGWYSKIPAAVGGGVTAAPAANKRLVVIFLRGAVDGLSVVVPYGDKAYYTSRSQIAIQPPGKSGGALNLDGHFGLNPSLEAMMPFWQSGSLAFVQASGSPDASRSHFDAQDFMESGTPRRKSTTDGWMNRLLSTLPSKHSPTQAVSFTNVQPRIMKGKQPVANLALSGGGKKLNGEIQQLPIDRPQVSAQFDKLYQGNDPLSMAYKEGIASRKSLMESLNSEMNAADNGAAQVFGFAQSARKLAQAMVNDPSIQLVFTDVGGWDTHVNQGNAQGQLANKLKQLGDGIAVLLKDLNRIYPDTTVVVMSEFGRTVHENGNAGTDHGHGNVMWVAGGGIKGGKVYGAWPGLAPEALHEGRDLAITTDYRSVISSILAGQMKLSQAQLQQVFPGFTPSYSNLSGLVRA